MKRIPYIDGLRGYLIYSMTLSHLGFLGSNIFEPLSHKSLSIFFTGEGFMALSGMMIGYILHDRVVQTGVWSALAASLRRSGRIALYYLAVYGLVTLPLVMFDLQNAEAIVETFFRGRDPVDVGALALFASSFYRPQLFDILYLYIILIGLSPILIFVAVRFGRPVLVGLSVTIWLCVQYGLVEKFMTSVEMAAGAEPGTLFGSFVVYAWQLPFVAGLLLGMSLVSDWNKWSSHLNWIARNVMPYAIALCVGFACLRLMTTFGLISIQNVYLEDYLLLRPLTLANFAAFCVVLTCLLAKNTETTTPWPVRTLQRLLVASLDSRLLRYIGANSLLTFSASVVLTYWVAFAQPWLALLGPPLVTNSVVFAGLMAILFALAVINRRIRSARKPKPVHAARNTPTHG